MYPAPPNIATTVFARIPDKFRIHGRSNRWIDVQRSGAATDCFLEDPSSWKPQLTACKHQENRMDIDFPLFDDDHGVGDCAMRPIAPRLTRQAALGWARQSPGDKLRLVGISLLRCHPCRARLSRSLSPFALSTGTQVPVEPQRSPLPGTPITAHSDAFNCGF